jgi:hypothetical protein
MSAHRWMCAFKLVGGHVGKSAWLTPRSEYEGHYDSKWQTLRFQEKSLDRIIGARTVHRHR